MPAMSRLRVMFTAAALISGCTPEFVQIEGERILYEYDFELQPCAGNVQYLDQVIPFIEQQTGLKAPEFLRFTWLRHDDADSLALFQQRQRTRDLVFGRAAKSKSPVSAHELAHLVAGPSVEQFFAEGIAVAMSDIPEDGGYFPNDRYVDEVWLENPEFDPRRTLTAISSKDVNYDSAGGFVQFLLVHHGPERFADFYRGLNGPASAEWIGRQFTRAYGLDLDAELDRFLAGIPPCPADAFPVPIAECSGPEIPWEQPGELWRYEASMACDEPGVVGGIASRVAFDSFRAVTLVVAEADAGQYQLSLNDIDQARLRFGPCFGCPWEQNEKDVFLQDNQDVTIDTATVTLSPGEYYVRIASKSDLAPDVVVELRR